MLDFCWQRGCPPCAAKVTTLSLACVLMAASCLLLPACSDETSGLEPTPYRFIAEDPADYESLVGRSEEFAWHFDEPRAPARLEVSATGGKLEAVDGRAILSLAGLPFSLTWDVEIAAKTVDIIEVVLAPLPGHQQPPVSGTLEWAGPGQEFASERSLTMQLSLRGTRRRSPFAVRRSALWQGPIERLRLTFEPQQPTSLELLGVSGHRRTLSGEALSTLISRGCKVEVRRDVRNALPGLPGADIERQLEIAPNSRLSFSIAAMDRAPLPVRFRVSVDVDGGDRVGVFEGEILKGRARPWNHVEVDLSRFAGKAARIRLTTESFHPVDPAQGFPVWGNPEVHRVERQRPPPNIVLVSLDTLRADRLSLYGYERPTSANLDAWAERSATVFQNAIAQAPWTLPSHVSLLTGENAHRHGIGHEGSVVRPSLLLLSEILRQAGYASLAITGGGWLRPGHGFSQGFGRFAYSVGLKKSMAAEIETAIAWTREHRERPYFLFLHTYEVHGPYRPRQPYFSRFSNTGLRELERVLTPRRPLVETTRPEDGFAKTMKLAWAVPSDLDVEEVVGALYDSGVAAADELLGRLLDSLRQDRFFDNGILVVTSDHGEMLGEYGLAGHEYLYDENLRVPLLIAGPAGLGAGRRVAEQVRSIDVLPSILELAGLESPPGIDGRSLVELMKSGRTDRARAAWSYAPSSNHGLSLRLDNHLKYIFDNSVWAPVRHGESLFRIDGDGREEKVTGKPDLVAKARSRAVALLEREVPGLRMRFLNAGSQPLHGRLRGEMVTPYRIKSTDMHCDCISWRHPGEIEIEVPPETSFSLVFEGVTTDRVELALSYSSAESAVVFEKTLDLPASDEVLNIAADGASWQVTPSSEATPRTGVSLWWQGGHPELTSETGEHDPQLEDQLRALGYLR